MSPAGATLAAMIHEGGATNNTTNTSDYDNYEDYADYEDSPFPKYDAIINGVAPLLISLVIGMLISILGC